MKSYFQTRHQIATFIALLFHLSGFIAIGLFHSQLFTNLSPLTLLISFGLILWTQRKITVSFIVFIVLAFTIGFVAEYIGIHTNVLFGHYQYGNVLGPKWKEVPLLIGINWFGIMYCVGIAMHMLQQRLEKSQPQTVSAFNKYWLYISFVVDGAALAVLFDWILEPVAVKLDYWQWQGNEIPSGNYWGWFFVSALVLFIFKFLRFPKDNLFAVHLLLIQIMFFLLLRTFY